LAGSASRITRRCAGGSPAPWPPGLDGLTCVDERALPQRLSCVYFSTLDLLQQLIYKHVELLNWYKALRKLWLESKMKETLNDSKP
jgi:hypothetical protein